MSGVSLLSFPCYVSHVCGRWPYFVLQNNGHLNRGGLLTPAMMSASHDCTFDIITVLIADSGGGQSRNLGNRSGYKLILTNSLICPSGNKTHLLIPAVFHFGDVASVLQGHKDQQR